MWNDLKFAVRQLQPGRAYTQVAVLTLALGIGANTALMTVVEDVLLRPLPYAHSERLIFIGPKTVQPKFANTSYLNYRDIRDQSKSFEAVGMPIHELWGNLSESGGLPRTIVGVMPALQRFPDEMSADVRTAVWLPLVPSAEMLNERRYSFSAIIARLRPGVEVRQAQAELNTIAEHIRFLHSLAWTCIPISALLVRQKIPRSR